MALRAGGSAPNITAFVLRESVALVSGQCGVPQWPGTTRLSRGFGQQRGHAGRPVFLIELRCALWASPPSITAFVLPALLCHSVHAALLRPVQVMGSYIASASQVLVSALERRYGLGSLAHRAGGAVASSVTMCPRESLRFVTEAHRHLSPVCEAGCASQPQRRRTALAESHPMKACASQGGSQSAVALGVGLGSLAHRGWLPSSTAVGDPQLRQSYITPHCIQCPPVSR